LALSELSDQPGSGELAQTSGGEARASTASLPFVSVAVRSYRRLPCLLELLERLQAQAYPNFEVVVIEQSIGEREGYRARLEAFALDARLRILEYPPLGAGRARNEAARQARGDIVLFLDDDDLPMSSDWIATHARNYDDPLCVAVSGRHVVDEAKDPSQYDTQRNHRLCLRYSWLKFPRGRTYHSRRIVGVTQVAGTNASIRRQAIERGGGWDDETDHDEDSFNFRFARVRRDGEYFAYDPCPAILRRLDVPGGLGRRQQSVAARLRSELRFSHGVIRKYHPWRFWALYPAYVFWALERACRHVFESRRWAKHRAGPSAVP
jgi:glycosyltransferase involved in cell wall biosynthesis